VGARVAFCVAIVANGVEQPCGGRVVVAKIVAHEGNDAGYYGAFEWRGVATLVRINNNSPCEQSRTIWG